MEHSGGRSGSGRIGGRSSSRPIRGGRATPSAPSVGRGLGGSPEWPSLDHISSSPSVHLSSSPSLYMSSSPSTTDSIMGGARVPSTSSGPHQHTASPQSQVGEEGSSSDTPKWGTIDPETGKIWIRPAGDNEFYPYNQIGDWISNQIFRNFTQPWGSWKQIPKENRERWFEEFLREFRSLPEDRAKLKKSYNYKGGRWLSDRCYKLRRGRGKKDWIQPDTADELIQKWAQDPKFQDKSEKNKQNRARMEGPSYVGGSIPISEHRRKIVESGEVPAGSVEWATFERTHSKQSEGSERQWINPKAKQVAETFQKLSQDRAAQTGIDPLSSYSDNESMFFEAAGGFNKKGRVFGFGASAGRLKQTKRSSSGNEDVSSDELKKMKALVAEQATQQAVELSQVTEQMTQKQEMMRQQMLQDQELMRQHMLQEQEMIKEQMRQQMIHQQQMMEERMTQQQQLMMQMQLQLNSLMKDKGKDPAPDGDDDGGGGSV